MSENEDRRRKLEEDLRKTGSQTKSSEEVYDLDPDEALAMAIDALIGNPRNAKTMSFLKSEDDVQKIWLLSMMSRRKGLTFLKHATTDKLLLTRSGNNGIGSRQLIEALRNMNGAGDEKLGLTDRIRNAVKRDFVGQG